MRAVRTPVRCRKRRKRRHKPPLSGSSRAAAGRPFSLRGEDLAMTLQRTSRRSYLSAGSARDLHMPGFLRSLPVALALVLCVAPQAGAQDRRVPTSPAEFKLSFAPIVQRTSPAVVNVYAAKMVQNRNPLLDDPLFRR